MISEYKATKQTAILIGDGGYGSLSDLNFPLDVTGKVSIC